MLFSPGKKMAILMLLTILILSLLLESFTREGMDVATVVNEDAPKESDQDQSSSKQSSSPDKQSSSKQSSSPDGIQLPDGKKPITVSEITSILAKNQAVKDLLK
jgi:cytoskeletal protein RodZ